MLGAILPDVRPHNSLAQQCANNGEQWDKQDDHSRIRIKDRLADKEKEKDCPADKEKDAEESDPGDDRVDNSPPKFRIEVASTQSWADFLLELKLSRHLLVWFSALVFIGFLFASYGCGE